MQTAEQTRENDRVKRIKALGVPFPAEKVYQRQGAGGRTLDYVAIETVLGRLLEAAPTYSWILFGPPNVERTDNSWTVWVTGGLQIDDKQAVGVGAMTNPDLDMALKSANSEAIKNAAKNGWGVGLELWDADYREELSRIRAAMGGDLTILKGMVYERALRETNQASLTGAEVADHYNISAAELNDAETLRRILGM